MPKLPKKIQKAVAQADPTAAGGDFPLLDPGYYFVRLGAVEVMDGNYAPRWSATMDKIVESESLEVKPGRQWFNMNVPDEGPAPANYTNGDKKWAAFQSMSRNQLAQFFEAFGYSVDSDTDEMVGEWAKAKITIRTISSGPRQGEKTNEIRSLSPVDDDFDASEIDLGSEDETF